MVTVKTEGVVIGVAMLLVMIVLVTFCCCANHHDQRQLKKECLFRIIIPEGKCPSWQGSKKNKTRGSELEVGEGNTLSWIPLAYFFQQGYTT